MKKLAFFTAGLLIFLMAAACKPGSSPFSPIIHPVSRSMLKANGLRLNVSAASQDFGVLTFLIELKNEGSETVPLVFTSSQSFDVTVSTSGGSPLWQWSYDKAFAAVMMGLELKPGDVSSNRADWSLKANDGSHVQRGTYKARVWITSNPRDPELSLEFELTI